MADRRSGTAPYGCNRSAVVYGRSKPASVEDGRYALTEVLGCAFTLPNPSLKGGASGGSEPPTLRPSIGRNIVNNYCQV